MAFFFPKFAQPKYMTYTTKIIGFLIVFLICMSSSGQELLTNPGFEEANFIKKAPKWSKVKWGTINTEYIADTLTPLKGTKAQKISVNVLQENSGEIFKQDVIFEAGHTYTGGIWLKSPDTIEVRFILRKAAKYYGAGALKTVVVGPEWQYFTITGGFNVSTSGFFGIQFLTTGTLFVDEAKLVDVTTAINHQTIDDLGVIPRSFFGIHFNKLATHHNRANLNYGVIRMWDNLIHWKDTEPINDVWDWKRFDILLNLFLKNNPGHDLLYTFGYAPNWAIGSDGNVINLEDWRDHVINIGKKGRGKIKYYEVWNEANIDIFWKGSAEQMVEMTRIAREELLAIDSEIKILSPSFATGVGIAWLDKFLSHGGGEYIDIISFHIYHEAIPEHSIPIIIGIKNLIASYHLDHLPIWNTEGSVGNNSHIITDKSKNSEDSLSTEDGIAATARAYIVQWIYGVSNFSWYTFEKDEPNRANLSTLDNKSLLPPGIAYRETAKWLIGAEIVSHNIHNNRWEVEIERGDDYKAWIVWDTIQDELFKIPSNWDVAVLRKLDGTSTSIKNSNQITIGKIPVLLEM
jgi:hypothetical protein